MADDIKPHQKHGTWKLVKLNRIVRRRLVRGKWVFKMERGRNGRIIRVKARWGFRGLMQLEGKGDQESFAAVVKTMSCKAILAITAALDLVLEHGCQDRRPVREDRSADLSRTNQRGVKRKGTMSVN